MHPLSTLVNQAFESVIKTRSFAVAVSGGADSFALLHLTQQWAQDKNIFLLALTVDHQLRPESTSEVQMVADWCAKNDIAHEVLPWLGEKPQTGLQNKARNIRRQLLCGKCREHGIQHLLLGHQADDQAETMLMRLQRGTGLTGLKAMHDVTRDKTTKVALIRPLLNVRRAELRQYCVDHNLPFIDDPSNDKTEFERVRLRQALAALPALADGVGQTVTRLRRADEALQRAAQLWFKAHAQITPGEIWLPITLKTDLAPEIRLRVLHLALQALTQKRLSLSGLERLAQALDQPDFSGVTLSGIWVRPKVIAKEPGILFAQAPPRRLPS